MGDLWNIFMSHRKIPPQQPGINECASYFKRRVIGGSCGAAGPGPVSIRDPVLVSLSLTWRVETKRGAGPTPGRWEGGGGGSNYFWIIRPWFMLLCSSQNPLTGNELLLWAHNDNWVLSPLSLCLHSGQMIQHSHIDHQVIYCSLFDILCSIQSLYSESE